MRFEGFGFRALLFGVVASSEAASSPQVTCNRKVCGEIPIVLREPLAVEACSTAEILDFETRWTKP